MISFDMDCVRDVMLHLQEKQKQKSTGKPKPIHMKNVLHAMEQWDRETTISAFAYIFDNKLAEMTSSAAPRLAYFKCFTPKGQQFLERFRDTTFWDKAKEHAKKLWDCSLTQMVVEKGIDFLLGITFPQL